jgi:hypothetical protein
MPLSYAQNKKHIYAWRAKEENREKYAAICRKAQRKCDEWKRIQRIFLNIMLN